MKVQWNAWYNPMEGIASRGISFEMLKVVCPVGLACRNSGMKASVWEVFRKMECLRRVDLTRIPKKKEEQDASEQRIR